MRKNWWAREEQIGFRANKHTPPVNSTGSGRRSLVRLIVGLRVSDDLPVGGGAAHVGGAPAAARPRQEAKAAAGREEETGLMSDL